jgi:hypothetical protein
MKAKAHPTLYFFKGVFMNTALLRWTLFLLVGLPIQALVYVVYPLLYLYWRIAIYKAPQGDKILAQHEQIPQQYPGYAVRANGLLLDNVDDHGAFTMYGVIGADGLKLIVDEEGNFMRRYEEPPPHNLRFVSGDTVIAWCFAYTFTHIYKKPVDTLLLAAKNYLKYLGTRTYDENGQGYVSNRCNNFGVNYCNDSEAKGIGQPMAGPQFYTNSALFALASQHSVLFKIVFWVHWLLFGGWYWCWAPVMWSKDRPLHYVRDMTMKALYVHKFVFGNRWWIRKPMEHITYDLSNVRNDLWYAMLGLPPVSELPAQMDSFFSQKEDCTSRPSDRINPLMGPAIKTLAEQARTLNNPK